MTSDTLLHCMELLQERIADSDIHDDPARRATALVLIELMNYLDYTISRVRLEK